MYKLTEEGKEYLKNGLPEKQLLKYLGNEKPLQDVAKLTIANIAIGWAKKNKWILIENNVVKVTEEGKKALKEKTRLEKALEEINKKGETEADLIKILLSRKLIIETKETKPSFWQRLLSIFHKKKTEVKVENEIAQLTPEIIKTGEWKIRPFKKYDVNAPAPKIYAGKKQPYVQFIENIREILIGLGFQEMKGP
ncbi:MAG: hypothetical protein QXD55_01970, partial [Candidatus Aenigmatarchaeota archaeon]